MNGRTRPQRRTETNSERTIGRLEGTLESLAADFQEGQEEARKGRARIYRDLEAIRADAAATKHQLAEAMTRLDDAAPEIANFKKWKERFIGMQMLAAGVFMVLGGAVAIVWRWVAAKLGL